MIHQKFDINKNEWIKSSKNIIFSNNILQAELLCLDGSYKYNRIEIHPLLFNKKLINENGLFKYSLSSDEDDLIMNNLFKIYNGISIPFIKIKNCTMITVNIEKYNITRKETLSLLDNYKLPPVFIFFGYTPKTSINSKFYNIIII